MPAFVSLSSLSFLASASRYLSDGHFVSSRSSSPALQCCTRHSQLLPLPLPAATPCVVVFPRQLPSFPHCLRFRAPCPSPFLTSMSVELPIIRSSRCLGSVAFRTCSTEPCLHSYSVYCFYSMPRLGKLDLCRGHCLAFLTHLLSLFLCVGEL